MLVDRDRLIQLADASIGILEAGAPDSASHDLRRARARDESRYHALVTPIVLAAAALGAEGDPLALRYARAAQTYAAGYDERAGSDGDALALALEQLITLAGPRALPEARKLVGKRTPGVRAAVARGLASWAEGSEEVRALLFDLHADEDDGVRAAAREALGGRSPPPWHGVFPADPLAPLPAAEAARLRAPLGRALAALTLPDWKTDEAEAALRRACPKLPDAIVGPVLTRFLSRERTRDPRLIARWVRATQGADVARVLAARREAIAFGLDDAIALGIVGIGAEARARAIDDLIALVEGAESRADAFAAEKVLGALFGAEDDLRPIVARALGGTLEEAGARAAPAWAEHGSLARALGTAIRERASLGPLEGPAIDALEAGFPGAWRALAGPLRVALARSRDPRMLAYVERAIASSEDREAIVLAFRQLFATAPTARARAIATGALGSARLRRVLLETPDLAWHVLAPARRALVRGELAPVEAAAVVVRCLSEGPRGRKPRPPTEREIARARAMLEAIAADGSVHDVGELVWALAAAEAIAPDHAGVERLFAMHAASVDAERRDVERRLFVACSRGGEAFRPVTERLLAVCSASLRHAVQDILDLLDRERSAER